MKHGHEQAANPVCACSCDCKVAHGEHSLRLCSRCDVAYCVDCKKEWGASYTHTPYITTIGSSDSSSGVSYVLTACSHA